MRWIKKYLLWLLFLLGICGVITAQEDSIGKQPVEPAKKTPSPIGINQFTLEHISDSIEDRMLYIRHIYFEGNKKTRKVILLRELPFKEGDSVHLKDLPHLFEKAKTQVMNTALFHRADVTLSDVQGPDIDIKITVKEQWYIYPLPYLKPIDRNLNQWLFEKGASASRLDYGVKLHYDNVSGNNDKLRFYFVTGYTKQLLLSYNRPYIDKKLKWGMNLSLALGKNHEINYASENDKQLFLKDENDYTRNFFKGTVELSYRPAFYTRHFFGVGYNTLRVADTVLQLNPRYLNFGATEVRYPEVYYRMVYQNLDYIPYPTSGYAAELFISKQGFNRKMNVWQLSVKGQGSWHLGPKTFYSVAALGTVKLPLKQPYYNSQLLGYGDMTMRGYEYYVIDGVAGGLVNLTLYKQLANFSLYLPLLKRFTDRLIPIKIYGKVYGNTGYVHSEDPRNSNLANRQLYGGGIGLDLWTVNNFTFKFELSFNQLGQNGLFLQKKTLY